MSSFENFVGIKVQLKIQLKLNFKKTFNNGDFGSLKEIKNQGILIQVNNKIAVNRKLGKVRLKNPGKKYGIIN